LQRLCEVALPAVFHAVGIGCANYGNRATLTEFAWFAVKMGAYYRLGMNRAHSDDREYI
jgi:hypothetical protein